MTWFNSAVTSWANSGSRDLHLDLGEVITPGLRGARNTLVDALRAAIRSGRLAPGAMLPPSRGLAADLGLARNTVAEAYAELVAEGWLASRQGAGTWVVNVRTAPLPARPRGSPGVPPHNLMPGSPDVSQFPRAAWLASTKRALASAPTEALRMGDPLGRIELREALTEYLGRVRGVRTRPDEIVICAGTRHGVEILGRALGGPIAVEAYGLFLFREALQSVGVATTPISVDEDGAVIAELDATEARAALLTPPTTSRTVYRCIRAGVPRSWTGRSAPTATCWRTTTTASSGTTASRSARCRAWIPTGSPISARPARACHRCCGWAGWCCRRR